MQEEKKGLSWLRLILLQIVIGCTLIGIFAYVFRIGVDEVQIVPKEPNSRDMFDGVPMRMNVTYPGIGTISIDDPKELIAWKATFSRILSGGQPQTRENASRLLLTGSIAYLDQEDIPFQIGTSGFRFGSDSVNSLDISAEIRKLQNMLIDKTLTADTVSEAIANRNHQVFRLQDGLLTTLSDADRAALTMQMRSAVRLIDFSHFDFMAEQPSAHFVVQLSDKAVNGKHWLHVDRYDNAYFIVFDLLDETNHKAYFKLRDAS
ncbi:hypothetical protein BC351_05980 [Paenibacillus ferrarius]|uniref:DUF3919 domain-containing protein n=1 Tax=Paenibacillus ferrarius TaxID=1469647 RepID=A0A1V4HFJ7_9BACL|nr:DUF3919 family protein [Paenibacillus ferrarius]OPH53410.1 hypothetical protein BC351_05980 [Paenibacillus ferrarius]